MHACILKAAQNSIFSAKQCRQLWRRGFAPDPHYGFALDFTDSTAPDTHSFRTTLNDVRKFTSVTGYKSSLFSSLHFVNDYIENLTWDKVTN